MPPHFGPHFNIHFGSHFGELEGVNAPVWGGSISDYSIAQYGGVVLLDLATDFGGVSGVTYTTNSTDPTAVAVNATTGVLRLNPYAEGTYGPFTVTATNSAGSDTTDGFTLTVTALAGVPEDTFGDYTDVTPTNGNTFSHPSNYLICDRTGFRVSRDEGLVKEWTGAMVRKESWERRHPQEMIRSKPEKQRGSERPEQQDTFIDYFTDPVTLEDLG